MKGLPEKRKEPQPKVSDYDNSISKLWLGNITQKFTVGQSINQSKVFILKCFIFLNLPLHLATGPLICGFTYICHVRLEVKEKQELLQKKIHLCVIYVLKPNS